MKILVVSDTHRKNGNLCRVLDKVRPVDMVIHLGDAEGSEDYIQSVAGCPLEIIAGNNDFFTSLPKEKEIAIGNYQVLLTHGHYYNVNLGIERLAEEARARNIDIAMFGHTHRPAVYQFEDLALVNPGSLSYPRQEGRQPSYILMEIDRQGLVHYTVNYLNRK